MYYKMSVNSKSDKTLNKTCRICMDSQSTTIVQLNEENGWLSLFEYCFGLQLSSLDQARVLCHQCADKVKSYSCFKQKCYKSNEFWKSLYLANCHIEITYNNKIDDETDCDNDGDNNNGVEDPLHDKCDNINAETELSQNDPSNSNNNTESIKNVADENKLSTDTEYSILKNLLLNKNQSVTQENENYFKAVSSSPSAKAEDSKNGFSCEKCQKKYASHFWYQRHLKSCSSKEKKENTVCDNAVDHTGTEMQNTQNDENNKTSQEYVHYCGVCTFSTNGIDALNKHLNEHWTNNQLRCLMCEFIGKDQAAMAAHRFTHYVNASTFQCHICQHKAGSQLTLQFHYRKVHLNKIGGLCSQPKCDKVFTSWRHWKTHEKMHKHPGYICDICGQKYRHKHHIVEHLINHTNPPTHVCDVCGKTFLRLRSLKVHVKYVHGKPEPVKCTHCNGMFKNAYYLRNHLRLMAMEKKWKCELCDMEYPILSGLTNHMKVHSDERPHSCHICGLRYKRNHQLKVHMRIHSGSKPFKCDLCTKSFHTKVQLQSHSIVHTGILPYKCLHCEKAYRSKQRMLKHCTLSHNK